MNFIDLNHPISNGMSTYSSDPRVSIIREKEISKDGSLLHSFTMGTHTGTHLDVPAHIIPEGKTLNDFPLNTFSGRTVKVDEHSYVRLDQIDENIDGIIYDTGWYRHFMDPKIFYGLDRPLIPSSLIKIVLGLGIKFFGCDLPSVDASGFKEKPVHHALLGSNIIVYESLTNLDQLPLLVSFSFYGFPLSFEALDGSPVRAVGVF
jgi:kynurenine formamidase